MDLDKFEDLTDEEYDALPDEERETLWDACAVRDRELAAAVKKYDTLTTRLDEIGLVIGAHLTDWWQDHDEALEAYDWDTKELNVEGSRSYWESKCDQAAAAAVHRAEEVGVDLNDHFDTPIH